jgi:hypothetical protein
MLPSLFHLMATPKLAMKQGLQGETRAQRQGDFKDNSYIKCLAILSLTQMHEMMPILRVSMKLISRPLSFAMMFLCIIVSTHFMMSLVINVE